jgi:hypothetical protein
MCGRWPAGTEQVREASATGSNTRTSASPSSWCVRRMGSRPFTTPAGIAACSWRGATAIAKSTASFVRFTAGAGTHGRQEYLRVWQAHFQRAAARAGRSALRPCRVELFIGCVFINFDDSAPSLRDSVGPLASAWMPIKPTICAPSGGTRRCCRPTGRSRWKPSWKATT